MASIKIEDGNLVIAIHGIRKLGTLKSELTIPLANVRGATVDPTLSINWAGFKKSGEWPGYKIAGTNAYGHYLGGTFRQDGDRVFWDVRDPERAIVVTLEDAEYARLIVEVDEPDTAVAQIEAALARGTSA
ncbi:hypothetical protein [Micromonospora sp. NPDC047074]|uniref:hypothetical protein n=1 Tax=Micromonospora sp. NPDC047074 TaxID=3154339 RepID=UPI0033D73B51